MSEQVEVYTNDTPFHLCHTVAILELKKQGGHCGAKKNLGGQQKCPSRMVIFSLFWRLSCYDLPYQTQHRLMNIFKYEAAFLFTKDI